MPAKGENMSKTEEMAKALTEICKKFGLPTPVDNNDYRQPDTDFPVILSWEGKNYIQVGCYDLTEEYYITFGNDNKVYSCTCYEPEDVAAIAKMFLFFKHCNDLK